MSRLWILAFVTLMMLYSAAAQSPRGEGDAVQVGDRWTYNQKDEISGLLRDTYTSTVTEVSAKEIVTSLSFRGRDNFGVVVFDQDWNRIANGALRYKPNDSHGVRRPLEIGKEWRLEYEERNVQNGMNRKGTSVSKVAARETVATDAGTFDTFRIERQVKEFNAADPSRLTEIQFILWFAPEINHWVRRTMLTKLAKRTVSNTNDELIEFGRKQ